MRSDISLKERFNSMSVVSYEMPKRSLILLCEASKHSILNKSTILKPSEPLTSSKTSRPLSLNIKVFTSPSSSHIALSSTNYLVSFTFGLTVFVISVLRILSISIISSIQMRVLLKIFIILKQNIQSFLITI